MSEFERAQDLWAAAGGFKDLCELTARFVEGRLSYSPAYGAETVDEETEPLVPYLAALNRAGFMTMNSQPGEDSPEWKQRAFVDGYALEHVAKRIARMSLYTDLHIVVAPPGSDVGYHTPVIVRDFMPHGWSGFSSVGEIEFFAEDCGPLAMRELRTAWSISVIDLDWGRADHLWSNLARELCYSERPHPELGLDTDLAI